MGRAAVKRDDGHAASLPFLVPITPWGGEALAAVGGECQVGGEWLLDGSPPRGSSSSLELRPFWQRQLSIAARELPPARPSSSMQAAAAADARARWADLAGVRLAPPPRRFSSIAGRRASPLEYLVSVTDWSGGGAGAGGTSVAGRGAASSTSGAAGAADGPRAPLAVTRAEALQQRPRRGSGEARLVPSACAKTRRWVDFSSMVRQPRPQAAASVAAPATAAAPGAGRPASAFHVDPSCGLVRSLHTPPPQQLALPHAVAAAINARVPMCAAASGRSFSSPPGFAKIKAEHAAAYHSRRDYVRSYLTTPTPHREGAAEQEQALGKAFGS